MKIKKFFLVALIALCCITIKALPIKALTIDVSDETELRAAIVAANPGDVINFTADIYLLNTITISYDDVVTFSGDYVLYGANGQATIFVEESGILTIDGITVSHKTGESGVGIFIGSKPTTKPTEDGTVIIKSGSVSGNSNGIFNNKGTLRIEGGTISNNNDSGVFCSTAGIMYMSGGRIVNNQAAYGGGIITNGPLFISGGEISGNTATIHGGGIYAGMDPAVVTMTGGTITNNTAGSYGGGVVLGGNASMTMSAGTISFNTAGGFGGGFIVSNSTLVMSGGSINGNQASDGGGLFVNSGATFTTSGSVSITNNKAVAADGEGGGIYTQAYTNLNLSSQTYFGGNSAYRAFNPPANADTSYPNIRYLHLSVATHPLNNYDINYAGIDEPVLVVLTYDPNGGSGGNSFSGVVRSVGVASASEAGVSRAGYQLSGWNTAANGSGTAYNIGDIINLDSNLTLFAQWELVGESVNTGDPVTPAWYIFGISLLALAVTASLKKRKAITK